MRTMRTIQGGFTLVSAIFLLVVIAALGAFAVSLSSKQHVGSALDLLGARAYQAARAGIDWGAYQVLQDTAFAATCQGGVANHSPLALPGTLAGFTVAVNCTATSNDEGARTAANGNPVWVYRLTATATTQNTAVGAMNHVERQISVTIWR